MLSIQTPRFIASPDEGASRMPLRLGQVYGTGLQGSYNTFPNGNFVKRISKSESGDPKTT
jgi:hypothetical protein